MNFHPDLSRQGATAINDPIIESDISKYTFSVADAVLAFKTATMSVTERTIQRYCHSGKLRALRVDPDTRQPTDADNYLFLIDPTSIPERIALLREKQEFVSPTVVATSRDATRQHATRRDVSESVAPAKDLDHQEKSENEATEETARLQEKIMSLEIDKRVRDGLLEQMKEDRKELLGQLQKHVETMTNQSRQIGQLEVRLELSAPQMGREKNLSPEKPEQPTMHWVGNNENRYKSEDGV